MGREGWHVGNCDRFDKFYWLEPSAEHSLITCEAGRIPSVSVIFAIIHDAPGVHAEVPAIGIVEVGQTKTMRELVAGRSDTCDVVTSLASQLSAGCIAIYENSVNKDRSIAIFLFLSFGKCPGMRPNV